MFNYSPRENTKAFEMGDDVPMEIKTRRLNEIIKLQNEISTKKNQQLVGKTEQVLIEGESKKSKEEFCGRTDTNKTVIFSRKGLNVGEYIPIKIQRANSATLFGEVEKKKVVFERANDLYVNY